MPNNCFPDFRRRIAFRIPRFCNRIILRWPTFALKGMFHPGYSNSESGVYDQPLPGKISSRSRSVAPARMGPFKSVFIGKKAGPQMSIGCDPQAITDLTEMMGQRTDETDFPLGILKTVTHRGAVNGFPGDLNQRSTASILSRMTVLDTCRKGLLFIRSPLGIYSMNLT